jgi:hypothetical protein
VHAFLGVLLRFPIDQIREILTQNPFSELHKQTIAAFWEVWYQSALPLKVFGSTFQGLDLRRPGGKDSTRLGKEMAR